MTSDNKVTDTQESSGSGEATSDPTDTLRKEIEAKIRQSMIGRLARLASADRFTPEGVIEIMDDELTAVSDAVLAGTL